MLVTPYMSGFAEKLVDQAGQLGLVVGYYPNPGAGQHPASRFDYGPGDGLGAELAVVQHDARRLLQYAATSHYLRMKNARQGI